MTRDIPQTADTPTPSSLKSPTVPSMPMTFKSTDKPTHTQSARSTTPRVRIPSLGIALLLAVAALVAGVGVAQARRVPTESFSKQVGDTPPPPGGGSEVGDTDPPPPGGTQAYQPIETLDEFLNLDAVGDVMEPPNPGGTRGNICPISPGTFGPVDLVWSDRPLFMWRGTATELLVKEMGADNDNYIWKTDLTETNAADGMTYIVPYTGAPLTPDIYQWVLIDGNDEDGSYLFEVLSDRDEIDQALGAIATDSLSEAEQALQQAQVFLQEDLWSDALQALYEGDMLSEAFVNNVCAPEPPPAE